MLPKPVKQKKKRRAFKPSGDKSAAMKRADHAFSWFIRQRDANEAGVCVCISCEKSFHWVGMDNGHFIGRSKQGTRYDEQNCAAQCKTCNTVDCGKHNSVFRISRFGMFKHTKDVKKKHAEGLIARHGPEILEELQRRSLVHTPTSKTYFDEIAKKYRNLCEKNGWMVG